MQSAFREADSIMTALGVDLCALEKALSIWDDGLREKMQRLLQNGVEALDIIAQSGDRQMLSGLALQNHNWYPHGSLLTRDEEGTLERYRYLSILAGQPMDLPVWVVIKTMAGTIEAFDRALDPGNLREQVLRSCIEAVSRRLGYLDAFFLIVPRAIEAIKALRTFLLTTVFSENRWWHRSCETDSPWLTALPACRP
jgi:hypothetical protein